MLFPSVAIYIKTDVHSIFMNANENLFSTGAVTGFKMDHFNVLDPRKQELLEARIGGRVWKILSQLIMLKIPIV